MDDTYNFLEEDWLRDGAQDLPNELFNLSDHSDYAMESTSDLMDWSSLFMSDDQNNFSDQKNNNASTGAKDLADLIFQGSNNNVETLSGFGMEKGHSIMTQQDGNIQKPFVTSNLQVQIPIQQLQNYQQVNQLPAPLFIQPQQSVQQIQLQQQQQIQVQQQQQIQLQQQLQQHQIQLPQQQIQLPQQQFSQMLPSHQPLHISFQAASSLPSVFSQPQQIILQQNPQSIHTAQPQIFLQPSQSQVIISPPTQQQQICIPSTTQKVQLLQQQPQQQMFILNGGSSGSNLVETPQIVLAPMHQAQQNNIVIQQPQVPPVVPHQTIMVQIGNQLFQIQSPKNSTNISNVGKVKNGLIKINARHSSQSNSPTLFGDSRINSKLGVLNKSIDNKLTSGQLFVTSNANKNLASSSTISLQPKFITSMSSSSPQLQLPSAPYGVLPTPVAKVRPLECKNGSKAVKDSLNDSEFLISNQKSSHLDLSDKMQSALMKMAPNQRQSFIRLSKSVLKPDQSVTSFSQPVNSMQTSTTLLKPNPPSSAKLSSNNISTKLPTFVVESSLSTGLSASGSLQSATSKQSHFSKDFLKLSVGEKFKIHLLKDQKSALQPDTKSPFLQLRDSLRALAPYHVHQARTDDDATVSKAEEMFEDMSYNLLEKKNKLLMKYQHIMLNKSMVHHDSVEDVMLGRMFLLQEMSKLKEEKKLIQTDPDSFIPRPVLPPEEMAALYPKDSDHSDSDDQNYDEEGSVYEDEQNENHEENHEMMNKLDNICEQVTPEKHIIIKIKHHDGTFSASPACKRPAPETLGRVTPIKIARIRLKRIDANDVETQHNNQGNYFQVVGNECNQKNIKEIANTSSKTGNLASNPIHSKPHAITAVVTPFHKHQEYSSSARHDTKDSFAENKFPEQQSQIHSPVNGLDMPLSGSSPSLPPKDDVFDGNLYFDLLDDIDDGMVLNNNYNGYAPKQSNHTAFVNSNVFDGGYHPMELSAIKAAPPMHSRNNDTQMFASDSEEFLDSNLEIEMQSAIQSILSQRTE